MTRGEHVGPLARRPPMRRRPGPGMLVTLNGLDGAGKSSAAAAIEERLRDAGYSVKHEWQRLGDMEPLDRIAAPVKKVLPLRRPIAADAVTGRSRMRGPLGWGWTAVVALESARAHMLSTGITTWGIAVIADRWVTDSLVDLEVRYGRHRLAERILRSLAPRADLDILLEIDAATSERRKPGDQPRAVLDRMAAAYARAARLTGATRLDASRPHEQVLADVLLLVDEAIGRRRARTPAAV